MTLLVPPQWSLRQAVEAVGGTLEVSWPEGTGMRRFAVRWRNHVMDTTSPSVLWDWLETLGAIRLLTDKEATALGAALSRWNDQQAEEREERGMER